MNTDQIWQLQQTAQINIQQVVADLLHGHESYQDIRPSGQSPIESKMGALKELGRVLIDDKTCTASSFLGILDVLFKGIRSCLNCTALMSLTGNGGSVAESKEVSSSAVSSNNNQVSDAVVEVVLKANQVLFEMMPDICHQEDLEIQMAQLIPIFIENLGSPKAVVRKSTHKCIGTYVKLTKKIEFVILHIIHTGLENSNSRTRQHSMLVIPALLSLKTTVMEKECAELKELIDAVLKRIKSDSSEIVSKTGKKLILELQKCYPNTFKAQYIDSMRSQDRQICLAVMANDDAMLKQILQGQQQALSQLGSTPGAKSALYNKQGNELSDAGREIMNGSSLTPSLTKSSEKDLWVKEVKQEPKYPRFSNGLLFSFLKEEQVEMLTNENNEWKERTTVIESIEVELNQVLATSDRKMVFLPYATPFIGFILQFIKDINFKISLTAIQITGKLLVLSIVNIQKHYSQLVTTLIEKLSDSKVVIRQAVLKCCGLIITSHSPGLFSSHATRFLQHTNWHVREGILHLTANCLIAQSQQDELNNASGINADKASKHSSSQGSSPGQASDHVHLALSPTLISELCQVTKIETKSKIQQMAVDCLALSLDISPNRSKTEQLMMREFGIGMDFSQDKDRLVTKDFQLISQIKVRQNPDCLPTMQIDGSIEFKPAGITPTSAQDAPTNQVIETGASRDAAKSPKGVRASAGAATDSKHSAKHQQKLLKRDEDDLKLQMRFQQERVHNNQSHAGTAQKPSLLPEQPQAFDLVVPQASVQLQPNYQLQNRQQNSASTINNPGVNAMRELKAGRPGVETTGLAPEYEVPTPTRSALVSKNRPEPMGAGLQQKGEVPGLKSASKPEDDARDQAKISMWLPSFQGQQQAPAQYGNQQASENKVAQSPYVNASSNQEDSKATSQKPRGHQAAQISAMAPNPVKLDRLNATASSSATFVDDGRSIITNTTLVSSSNNKITSGGQSNQRIQNLNPRMLQSPAQSENQKFTGGQQNIRAAQASEGYTPGPHANKPRHIQSNEIRQRTLEDISLSQASPSPKHVRIGGTTQNDFISIQQSPRMINETHSSKTGQVGGGHSQVISHSEIKVQQRNMSQSSGAPGGFHVDKTQINERLQLLKSTFKYKNPSETEMQSNLEEMKSFENIDSHNKYRGDQGGKASSEYNARGLASKPTALNNNNYMLQTAGSGARVSGTGAKILGNPQQTHNSFGFSNVSTNVNNPNSNHHNASSSSANRQMPSSNSTGQNLGGQTAAKANVTNVYGGNRQSSTIGGAAGPAKGFMAGNPNAGSATGPIKATALPQHDYLQTIQPEENAEKSKNAQYGNNENDGGSLAVPGNLHLASQKPQPGRTRKPPVGTKTSTPSAFGGATPHDMQRASSVTMHEQPGAGGPTGNSQLSLEKQASAPSSVTHYNAPEEPLRNPELQFKQAIDNLKSDDWQTVFDSLNVVKRIALFHKHLLAASNGTAGKECIKSVVKQTDNLRSQVAKNACMTLQIAFSELTTKDLDPHIDLVLAALLKKATDTNHFVSEQAEKALTMVCHACTDTKVFNCLQAQTGRANPLKQKICMCYSTLIAKLGQRIKTFRDCDRLVKTVVGMLSEGAEGVRNQAKLAILTLKNNLQSGREFDGVLMRCNLTDKQIEQAKKVAQQGDYESLSNYANTRYGGSMRGSSMDSRGAAEAQRRTPNHIPGNLAAGSDGFAQSTFSDAKMQATFLSGGAGAASQLQGSNYAASNGFGVTGSSNTAFKKRQASVSKPVDPQLMDDFKNMIAACSTNDWNKRLTSIDTINNWIAQHSISVKQTQPSKFIQLVDVQCKLAQDNNAKVQSKALQSFSGFLQTDNLRQLIDQNLAMVIQAMAHNLTSTSPSVRNSSEELIALLASTSETPSQLIQPLVAQLSLSAARAKAPLVERLTHIIQQVDPSSMTTVDRYVSPLLKPNSKLQTEASTNPRLREALKGLELTLRSSLAAGKSHK